MPSLAYAPYDTITEPAKLGLTQTVTSTPFGNFYCVHSHRTSDEVTLFLHGVGGTWATWTPLVQCANAFNVVLGDVLLVDLPGFGASENRQPELKATAVGDMLMTVATQLGWNKVRLTSIVQQAL